MAAVTAGILAAASLGATGYGMMQQKEEADYNAELAERAGQEQQEALESEARRLSDEQRDLKATQRVALAAGGGGSQQAQPLMLLADQANKMQQDQSELFRQGRLAKSRGKSQSLLYDMQGKERLISGAARMAGQGYGLYQGFRANRSTTEK